MAPFYATGEAHNARAFFFCPQTTWLTRLAFPRRLARISPPSRRLPVIPSLPFPVLSPLPSQVVLRLPFPVVSTLQSPALPVLVPLALLPLDLRLQLTMLRIMLLEVMDL
jgi:hypothetical protein